MFCPNCGQDCGSANFCSQCGTQVQKTIVNAVQDSQKQQEVGWRIGMPCPNCGGAKIENGCCAFCGIQLIVDHKEREKEELLTEIPCGRYDGITSSLILYEKECVVRTTLIFKKYETQIPFDKITVVSYVRPLCKATSLGYLLFRWEGNKDVLIPVNNNYSADKTTITTATGKDTLFYHIYQMLKVVAPSTAEFRMTVPTDNIPGLDELASKVNLDVYFDKFAPYRKQAVEELQKRTGASVEAATALIDRTFDARQEEIYANNPAAAIHDLNLIVGAKKAKEAQFAKESAERKERLRRDILLEEMIRQNNKR